jgi:excisionase family DNA binding protein
VSPAAPPLDPTAQRLPNPSYHTVAEAAALMRVSKMTVDRLSHGGELQATQIGRSFRIPAAALTAYQATATTTGARPGR